MSKVIKEIIIMLVICLVTMLVLAILLYRYIPNRKVIPEVVKYVASEDIQTLLDDDVDSEENRDDILLTYELTSADLNYYQAREDYVPGKANPFGAYSGGTQEGATSSDESTPSENTPNGDASNQNTSSKNSEDTLDKGTVPSVYSENSGTK